MNAQQMQELCRELVGALKGLVEQVYDNCWIVDELNAANAAIDKAETAFNPTPAPTGCVETAATVPACVGTGETVKALGVGSCPVCGGAANINYYSSHFAKQAECGNVIFTNGQCSGECGRANELAITRAKQLAEAEAVLRRIVGVGGANGGKWSALEAEYYFRNKPKEPTA